MNPKHLAARHVEGTRLWNEMAQRELLQAQQVAANVRVVNTDLRDLREFEDPDVPYDPITEIDFLLEEEVKDIGELE